MRLKNVLFNRVAGNIIFWIIVSVIFYSETPSLIIYFPLLVIVLFLSYGLPGYVNNVFLIPRFLLKRHYKSYFTTLFFLLALATLFSYGISYVTSFIDGFKYMDQNMGPYYHVFPSIFFMSLLTFGKFISDNIAYQSEKEELIGRQIESELELLKSQINPHFLFNALNTVYGMALKSDTATAPTILKLSTILRYTLYENAYTEIPLEKELLFLKEFIEFNQLRIIDKKQVELVIEGDFRHYKIPPLLLIPLVENAFKHGLDAQAASWIKIRLSTEQNKLYFKCENSVVDSGKKNDNIGKGIGLKNVRRRLELLYKNRHELTIENDDNSFAVTLKIELS